MAHFRGELHGARGTASRLGTKRTGLRAVAQTWHGQVVTYLEHDAHNKETADMVTAHACRNPATYGPDYYLPLFGPVDVKALALAAEMERPALPGRWTLSGRTLCRDGVPVFTMHKVGTDADGYTVAPEDMDTLAHRLAFLLNLCGADVATDAARTPATFRP